MDLAPALIRPPANFAAQLVETMNMYPDVPRGSVVFLGDPGYRHEGIYAFDWGFGDGYRDLRRVGPHYAKGERVGFYAKCDNAPVRDIVTDEQMRSHPPRLVHGAAISFTSAFADFLTNRYREVVR